MKDLPHSAEYIRDRLCRGDYTTCARFQSYRQLGKGNMPYNLYPFEKDEIKKVMECLQRRQVPED